MRGSRTASSIVLKGSGFRVKPHHRPMRYNHTVDGGNLAPPRLPMLLSSLEFRDFR